MLAVVLTWPLTLRLAESIPLGTEPLGLLEVIALPLPLVTVPDRGDDWINWLDEASPGVVAMVPFADGRGAGAFEPTVEAMLAGLEHGHPLVNSYSGLFPATHDLLWERMDGFPDSTSLDALHDAGVRYVVVDRAGVSSRTIHAIDDSLDVVFTGDERTVYEVPGARPGG